MSILSNAINSLFDLFFYPFVELDPIYGLSAIALFTSIIVLPIFKYTSDQEGIKKVKAVIMGHILELRLFRDDIRIVLSAQKNVLRHNMTYLKYTLKPLLFMFIPVVLIMIQTEVRFSFRPLLPGETAVVKIKMSEEHLVPSGYSVDVLLTVPPGLSIETPPMRVNGNRETYWRIKAETEGAYDLTFQLDDDKEIKKRILVSDKIVRLSPAKLKESTMNYFFHPADSFLSDNSVVESITVKYPSMKIYIFGWKLHWLLHYFILTLIFGVLLLKPLKVRI